MRPTIKPGDTTMELSIFVSLMAFFVLAVPFTFLALSES